MLINLQTTWGVKRLRATACWAQGITGAGVRVGHLDTGADGNHPALRGRIARFCYFDAAGRPGDDLRPLDSRAHGTHTAGLICGGRVNETAIGVAPDAALCCGVVIEGGQSLVRVLCGLDWLLDCGVRVLSMPLGLPGETPLFQTILHRLRQAGVLPVLSAGNCRPGRVLAPGSYDTVLTVGAIDAAGRVAKFSGSNGAGKPDVVAPGVDILSARPGGGTGSMEGTSMAAAYVAGVAALLFQADPQAGPDAVQQAIVASAVPLQDEAPERAGAGCVDATAALATLRGMHGGSN